MTSLTAGAIENIMCGGNVERPILQILGQKKISGGPQGQDRYRLMLSDGKYHHSSAMLATQLNHLVLEGQLDSFTVIRLDKYLCNAITPDKRVMILLALEVIRPGAEVGESIGSPQVFKLGATSGKGSVTNNNNNNAPKPEPQRNTMTSPPKPSGNQSVFHRNAPSTPGGSTMKVHPISSLNPYQNRWQIRARVTMKTPIRTWNNSRGEGKLFSMNFLDESGEIRATAFKEQVDKYHDMIEVGKVYFVSRGTLKTANKQYSTVNNDYEMTFNNDTQVTLCDETVDLPQIKYDFVPINQFASKSADTTADVIGIVKSAAECTTITGKASQREFKKRDLQLVDTTNTQINLTLWGNDAENFEGDTNPVIAVKGAKISEFGGRSLSVSMSSQMFINPDIPEAHLLRGWFDNEGCNAEFDSFRNDSQGGNQGGTNWKLFSEVKGGNIGQDKPEYFTANGTILFIKKDNCLYNACPKEDCNKKVIDQGNGMYRCEKCGKEYPNFKHRMILQVSIADFTDNQWATFFQDTGEKILGISAQELGELRDENDSAFEAKFQAALFKAYTFRMRAKMESYNDENRLKTVGVSATPRNSIEYNQKLIGDIEKLLSQ
ncbi:replication protein A 70 kDa DNA-binding subunit-like [Tubulanus polymorphus]|uniref:replication protein A 70 kDa DNA-binding subunit-like n=1 Tax=Tubulanus polymorphus TaxID=672921 RepID=UPI003DA5D9AE